MPDILPILSLTLMAPSKPTKVRMKELDEPQTRTKLTKKGVEMKCSKYKKLGHNKRSCKEEVGQNILVTKHKVGVHNQVVASTH
ncbi:hypothetical protein Gogos_000471 [Gossypium gossypioides]|uniref:Uncharacterized protein n=1 Tax=Gossypium gossypioides TaxID=34282 RepID=A0A7J9CSX7_GOSGO|nr:hypothetical protein [Gossypium gossypioides]